MPVIGSFSTEVPTTAIRVAVKRRLVELLGAEPSIPDVDIIYAWSGTSERDHIRVGAPPTSGDSSVPTMKSGRKHRDDRFGISCYILAATPGREHDEAEARVEVMLAAIDSLLADRSLLEDANGVPLPGVVMVTLGDLDGPDSDASDEGALAYGRCTVNVHARLT